MTHPVETLLHLIREFPIQAVAGAVVPLGQFAWQKLRMRQDKQRKLHLRERLVALNTFIASLDHLGADTPHRAESLEDALQERDTVLKELAASIAHARTSRRSILRNWWSLQRLALLNLPVRPLGWILRWSFFTLLVVTVVGDAAGAFAPKQPPAGISGAVFDHDVLAGDCGAGCNDIRRPAQEVRRVVVEVALAFSLRQLLSSECAEGASGPRRGLQVHLVVQLMSYELTFSPQGCGPGHTKGSSPCRSSRSLPNPASNISKTKPKIC